MSLEVLKKKGKASLRPFVILMIKLGISADVLSITGFLVTILIGYFFAKGNFLLGGIFILISGLFDAIDGEVARATGKSSKKGALLDSSIDRASEFFIFGGLLFYFRYDSFAFVVIYLSLVFSILVSYMRARGEGLGYSAKSGLMDRSGRMIYLFLASLFGERLFVPLMTAFMALTFLTVIQRWLILRKILSEK